MKHENVWNIFSTLFSLHSCPILERGFPIMEVEDGSSTERGKYHSTKHFFSVDQAQIQKTSGVSNPVLHMGRPNSAIEQQYGV